MARKKKGNWIADARKRMASKGTVGSYGHHTVAQEKRDIAKGGKIGRKAQFALNVRKKKGRKKSRS